MTISDIQLYELLKAKIGNKEAEAFLTLLDNKVNMKFEESRNLIATKEDLANTKVDLIKWMVGFWLSQMAAVAGLYLVK